MYSGRICITLIAKLYQLSFNFTKSKAYYISSIFSFNMKFYINLFELNSITHVSVRHFLDTWFRLHYPHYKILNELTQHNHILDIFSL